MVHVEIAATLLSVDHAYIPPREPSLNEAEKICLLMWDAAAAVLARAKAPAKLFAKAVKYAMYVDFRSATTASRNFLTPYEIIHGVQPNIAKLHRFYTRGFFSAS